MAKKNQHSRLIDEAEQAIENLFGDTSVSHGTTADSLDTLIQFIKDKKDALTIMAEDESEAEQDL